jgi:hypothetical protein
MDQIGVAVAAAAKQVAKPTGTSVPTKPLTTTTGAGTSTVAASEPLAVALGSAPKASQTVNAANLSPSSYLETEEEVNAYLERLRAKLMSVIQAGQRARIQ